MLYTIPSGFFQFPRALGSCVQLSSDIEAPGCSICSTAILASSTCTVTHPNGLTYSICSQLANGNKPSVTSCYVGTFSASVSSATATTCSPAGEFCKVRGISFNLILKLLKLFILFLLKKSDYATVGGILFARCRIL